MNATLADLLKGSNRAEVARMMTAAGVPTERDRVSRFAKSEASPQAHEIVALAPILRVPVDALTAIVAADLSRRSKAPHAAEHTKSRPGRGHRKTGAAA